MAVMSKVFHSPPFARKRFRRAILSAIRPIRTPVTMRTKARVTWRELSKSVVRMAMARVAAVKMVATPDLITHVMHKMTAHDGHRLPDAMENLAQRSLQPAMMLGDSHYGSTDNTVLTRDLDIDLVAPARPAKGAASGRLTLEDFVLDEQGFVLQCPNSVKPVSVSISNAKLQAGFDLSICRACPDIQRCPMQAAKRNGQFARFQNTWARATKKTTALRTGRRLPSIYTDGTLASKRPCRD